MRTPSIWQPLLQINGTSAGSQVDGHVAGSLGGSLFVAWTDASGASGFPNAVVGGNGSPSSERVLFPGASSTSPEISVTPTTRLQDFRLQAAFTVGTDTIFGSFGLDFAFSHFVDIEVGPDRSKNPALTSFADGGAFVSYTLEVSPSNWTIAGRYVSLSGSALPPVTIFDNALRTDNSHLATLRNGNLVVVYESENVGNPSANHDILFQLRTATGASVVTSTVVNGAGVASALDTQPDVAALESGGFVVVWTRPGAHLEDIFATIHDHSGNVVRAAFQVNGTAGGVQDEPHVTSMTDGGFLVSWEDDFAGVQRAQRFSASGNPLGSEFTIHVNTVGETDLATTTDGRTVFSFDETNSGDPNIALSIWDTRSNVANQVTGANFLGSAHGAGDQLVVRSAPAANSVQGLQILSASTANGKSTEIGALGADWTIDGAGDFQNDGRSDILMHRDVPGQLREFWSFRMGDEGITGFTLLGTVGRNWQVSGIGDFNNDGTSDVLIADEQAGGYMPLKILTVRNDATIAIEDGGSLFGARVDAVADFNGDGHDDVLSHYIEGGAIHLDWTLMRDGAVQSVAEIGTIGKEWQVVGAGDFDGDGDADILIQIQESLSRRLSVITVENGGVHAIISVGQVGSETRIDGIGDFNGDGIADIAIHADQGGSRTSMFMEVHDNVITAIHTIGVTGQEWLVQ